MNHLTITFIIVALLGLAGTGVFFIKNQNLGEELSIANEELSTAEVTISGLEDQKTAVEKELIRFKSTDLAKEAELLQTKLDAAEKDLERTESDLTVSQSKVSDLETTIKTLKVNSTKINLYLDAINAIETMLARSISASGISNVDSKIAPLNDTAVTNKWDEAKKDIDLEGRGFVAAPISNTVIEMTSRIRNLLP